MKKISFIIILVVVAAFILYRGSYKNQTIVKETAQSSAAIIKKGKTLAVAGDCVACHSISGKPPFTGGVVFTTPFGEIYSTNITPDKIEGIGSYSRDDFQRAVKYGYSKRVGNLYPAMPYTSYRKLTANDVDALWAYMKSLPSYPVKNKKNQVIFPANIRLGLASWNTFFFNNKDFVKNADKSTLWNRGKYLVEGLGHCGECHSPRNMGFAMDEKRKLEGAIIEGWEAVGISRQQLKNQGWTKAELNRFLQQGDSSKGTAFVGMFNVIKHSLSGMGKQDISAIAEYLLGESSSLIKKQKPVYLTTAERKMPGYATFVNNCAGCHGVDGLGKPNAVPPMRTNATFSSESPYNAIAVILRGLSAKKIDLMRGSVAMSHFNQSLNDDSVAELVNFSRQVWGGQTKSAVTAAMVKKIRGALEKKGWLAEQAVHANSN